MTAARGGGANRSGHRLAHCRPTSPGCARASGCAPPGATHLTRMRSSMEGMNCEFLTESPDSVVLAGGMYITEDNWVMPGYPNSTYLVFRQDGDKLGYLQSIVENDCTPGTQLFTNDLLEILAQY